MKTHTPSEARNLAAELLPIITPMGRYFFIGTALSEFDDAAGAAQAACEQPATAVTCRQIEQHLGLMVDLFLDNLHELAIEKPQEHVQVVLDCFEIAGSACHVAGLSNHAGEIMKNRNKSEIRIRG